MDDLRYIAPADLADTTGDYGAIGRQTTPHGEYCRKLDAIQAVRERYYKLRLRLNWREADEIKRIERGMR